MRALSCCALSTTVLAQSEELRRRMELFLGRENLILTREALFVAKVCLCARACVILAAHGCSRGALRRRK